MCHHARSNGQELKFVVETGRGVEELLRELRGCTPKRQEASVPAFAFPNFQPSRKP
jgi:hypothetical protein